MLAVCTCIFALFDTALERCKASFLFAASRRCLDICRGESGVKNLMAMECPVNGSGAAEYCVVIHLVRYRFVAGLNPRDSYCKRHNSGLEQ